MIIITGGAGFIGSNIAAALQEQGYKDIAIVDVLGTDDKWKNLAKRELAAIVPPSKLDALLEENVGNIEAIIHMGAISTTTETDADLILSTNFELSWHLWEFAALTRIPFIYASSAATYGDGSLGFEDDATLAHLNSLRPLNAYGWSKALFDRKVARELAENRPTPPQHVGLKFFNVYGPNEYHKGSQKSVVAHMFPFVKAGEPVRLFKSYRAEYPDGGQLRDFVWVGDVVDVIIWMLRNPKVSGLFNVGSGEARSFADLARATWAAMGKQAQITYVDMPETLRDKYQYYTKANLAKLRAAGYTAPMTNLEDGVRQYVQNYLNAPDIYR